MFVFDLFSLTLVKISSDMISRILGRRTADLSEMYMMLLALYPVFMYFIMMVSARLSVQTRFCFGSCTRYIYISHYTIIKIYT